MKSIVVIDDSSTTLLSTKQTLEKVDYKVTTCNSWTKVLPILRSSIPDLMLIDVDMPGLQGGEVLTSLKNNYPDIKMVFFSTLPEHELAILTKEKKADGYICKTSGDLLIKKVAFYID